ncbi:hypothetical protein ATO12_04985 [Aquimarina atlantica]|uniref:Aminotransferase class III n=1 Tax=Aquimarina atlantica TaxID=1317122 RepID=A0A023BPG2_9FLAO|nr:aminotransferase class III-fold pyridoxal phosphate-dependent enzyme [Aquimarina atlantica]EZH71975.1 hypothetical protein ATO12_04985 [Aquimarina atlantica]
MTVIDNIFEKIVSKEIDEKEAIQSFKNLQEFEQKELISKLRYQLSTGNKKDYTIKKTLTPLDQRDLSDKQREFIKKLALDYENFVPKSKNNVIEHQSYFVDQRRAFHLIKEIKELHFQITYENAEGAYVYDIDGNKYIDISGDMGVNIFGHKPKFILDAVKKAMDQGIPLAGYSNAIFETTKLFSEITGHERVLFTQSGTESVMVAVRIARAATQKKKIVLFEGAYHGLSDAVMAIKDQGGNSFAAGPGMLQEFAEQILVLDYGDKNALDIIEDHIDELAGILVEPVQSRFIYNKPIEFLKELRKLTLEKGIPLIFDEMITGFRVSPKGAQGIFNIKPDLATYGKIVGGGLPTGVIAGSAKYMDLIDGGMWNFNDDSMPKSKRTSMGGTHSQNPLKIASCHAVLSEIKRKLSKDQECNNDNCKCFLCELNDKTKHMVEELKAFFLENRLPITIDYFGSLFRFRYLDSFWGVTEALMFILMRMNGIETNIQGNCFLTTSHTNNDIKKIIEGVKDSLKTLIKEGFFYEKKEERKEIIEEKKVHELAFKKNESVTTQKKVDKKINDEQMAKLKELIVSDLIKEQELY